MGEPTVSAASTLASGHKHITEHSWPGGWQTPNIQDTFRTEHCSDPASILQKCSQKSLLLEVFITDYRSTRNIISQKSLLLR